METVHSKTSKDCCSGGAGSKETTKNSDQHDVALIAASTPG